MEIGVHARGLKPVGLRSRITEAWENPATREIARHTRRVVVTAVGLAVVVVGVLLLVLPGPGLLVVIAGLALLATEYEWARRLLERAREKSRSAASKFRSRNSAPS